MRKIKEKGLNPEHGRHDWMPKYELTLQHVFAVILYCDVDKLQREFSGTFRRENVFESDESVISRHSEYGNFGKLLVEMVEHFGISGYDGNGAQNPESGPFFCGINCILNVGSFAIILRGPCSTTTVKAIATNFATEKGMILKLNNDSFDAGRQRFFDCSWISNYFEESERLWIAGYFPLRIVSIVMVLTAKNYQNAMRSLYLFDAMISGVEQHYKDGMKANESDCDLIRNLMEWTLNGGDCGSSNIDSYLKKEWKLFLIKKNEIKLRLYQLKRDYQSLSELVVFKLVKNTNRGADGKENVLNPKWIQMFPSLNSVYISTYGDYYKFRLEALLDSMQSISPSITVTVHDAGVWIKNALSDEISAAFDAAGWDIEYDGKLVIKSKEE